MSALSAPQLALLRAISDQTYADVGTPHPHVQALCGMGLVRMRKQVKRQPGCRFVLTAAGRKYVAQADAAPVPRLGLVIG